MKRIERSILETIDFLNINDWGMCPYTKKMIKDHDEIKKFYRIYKENCTKEDLDKIVNFFWGKEHEIGTFGRFWDDEGDYDSYGYLVKIEDSIFYQGNKNYHKNDFKCWFNHFEPLTEIPKYEGAK